jgi:hypothetical protein
MTVDVNAIIRYESGEMTSAREELELFSELVSSGAAWSLQGHYGRAAKALIEQGLLYEDGELTSYALDILSEEEAYNEAEEYTFVRDGRL